MSDAPTGPEPAASAGSRQDLLLAVLANAVVTVPGVVRLEPTLSTAGPGVLLHRSTTDGIRLLDRAGVVDVDVAVGSRTHGRTKPHASIFEAALRRLEVAPADAAMVGDSPADDVAGARALGMRAILLDREGRYPDEPERIPNLFALPAALGLL